MLLTGSLNLILAITVLAVLLIFLHMQTILFCLLVLGVACSMLWRYPLVKLACPSTQRKLSADNEVFVVLSRLQACRL